MILTIATRTKAIIQRLQECMAAKFEGVTERSDVVRVDSSATMDRTRRLQVMKEMSKIRGDSSSTSFKSGRHTLSRWWLR